MSDLFQKNITVHHPVDARELCQHTPLPSVSAATATVIALSSAPSQPRPNYRPPHSDVAGFLSSHEVTASSQAQLSAVKDTQQSAESSGNFTGNFPPSEGPVNPVRPSHATGGPVDPSHATSSPVDPPHTTSSPVDPSHATSSAVDPSHATSSAVDPSHATSSAVDPSHATSSAVDPSRTTSSAQEPPAAAETAIAKKNASKLGPEERKLRRKAAEDRSAKLSLDIDKLLAEIDVLYDKCAEDNGVTLARVKKLAHRAPGMKAQRKTSNFNIAVYFKRKELNQSLETGDKLKLTDIQAAVKEDKDLQEILNDEEAMAELRKRYDEEKSEESVAAVRVSKRAEAKTVAEKVNLLQQECDFMFDSAGANVFGVVARGSFESTVISGYFGRGPADGFLRQHFKVGVQELTDLWESYVCSSEALGSRKLYHTEMTSEIVRLITQGLRDITGVNNIQMSYASFAKNIAIPYAVNITGWPSEIQRIYPQKLNAEETRALYAAWSTGAAHWYRMTNSEAKTFRKEAESNGELVVKPRQKRKRTLHDGSDGDDDAVGSVDEEEEEDRPRKKVNGDRTREKVKGSSGSTKSTKPKKSDSASKSKSTKASGSKAVTKALGSKSSRKALTKASGSKSSKSTSKAAKSAGGEKLKKRVGSGKGKKKATFIVETDDEEEESPDIGDGDDDEEAEYSD